MEIYVFQNLFLETIALGPKPSKSIESLKDSGEYVDVAKSNDKKRIVSQAISKVNELNRNCKLFIKNKLNLQISSMFASDHTKGQQQLSSGKSDIQASYYEKELEDWDCLGSKGISYPLSLYEGPLFKQSMKEIAQPNVGNRAYLIQSK